jgi:hypothetical protein
MHAIISIHGIVDTIPIGHTGPGTTLSGTTVFVHRYNSHYDTSTMSMVQSVSLKITLGRVQWTFACPPEAHRVKKNNIYRQHEQRAHSSMIHTRESKSYSTHNMRTEIHHDEDDDNAATAAAADGPYLLLLIAFDTIRFHIVSFPDQGKVKQSLSIARIDGFHHQQPFLEGPRRT